MDYGEWTEDSRNKYDKWDAISRCTTQVCIVIIITVLLYWSISSNYICLKHEPLAS